jgi:hypothetical protein
MTRGERAFWFVVEPVVHLGVGLFICGLAVSGYAKAKRRRSSRL